MGSTFFCVLNISRVIFYHKGYYKILYISIKIPIMMTAAKPDGCRLIECKYLTINESGIWIYFILDRSETDGRFRLEKFIFLLDT